MNQLACSVATLGLAHSSSGVATIEEISYYPTQRLGAVRAKNAAMVNSRFVSCVLFVLLALILSHIGTFVDYTYGRKNRILGSMGGIEPDRTTAGPS
jgi:hypothetical protein